MAVPRKTLVFGSVELFGSLTLQVFCAIKMVQGGKKFELMLRIHELHVVLCGN